MSYPRLARSIWPLLVLIAAAPRLLGAFFLPNAFGDAYVYILDIGNLTTKISSGGFRLTDLFGFWLPLYQLISALLNLLIRNGFYSGKLVSAVFGVGVCLFLYALTLTVTGSRAAATVIFLLIALNPLHIFYSASAMTDVPHSFFVLATLYFVLKQRWIVAAIFAALAGMTRVESWMLIALIPLIQLLTERRVSIITLLIMLVPPLFWFYISWQATGDALACFKQRQQYLNWLLAANPTLAHFSLSGLGRDVATLLVSADVAVLIASFMAGWFTVRQISKAPWQRLSDELRLILAPAAFFFAFFTLLLMAYLTHQQPIIFPRYGLILFTLGLPILAWAFLRLRAQRPQLTRRLLIATAAICLFDGAITCAGVVHTIDQYHVQRPAADYLRDHFDRNSSAQIFCDDGTVRALSGIPIESFVTSADTPADREGFNTFLKNHPVQYLVIARRAGSTPQKLFPELDSGGSVEPFRRVFYASSEFVLPTEIWIYQVR